MKVMLITYVLTGLVLIGASIPLVRGAVKPNPWYGVRLPETLSNKTLWYSANEYGGKLLIGVGALVLIVTLAGYFVPNLTLQTYGIICGGTTTVAVLAAAVFILRFVQGHK